ncbi:MAG TPA: transposase [Pirellulales bacterium]|jgi:transposase|nr:transposase [Pirellulales bacterium]
MNEPIREELWRSVAPLLAGQKKVGAGRPKIDDRLVLGGIVFVLRTGIPWARLPRRAGLGSGMTCLRRLRAWQAAGRWPEIEQLLKRHLPFAQEIDWQRAYHDRRQRRGGLRSRAAAMPARPNHYEFRTDRLSTLAQGLLDNFEVVQ